MLLLEDIADKFDLVPTTLTRTHDAVLIITLSMELLG